MGGEGSTWDEEQLARHPSRPTQHVWWTYGYRPIDVEGGVGGELVVCNDVTEQHLAREALARQNGQLLGDVNRMRDLFGQAPGFIAVLRGPGHIFEFTNAAYDRLIGRTDAVGRRVMDKVTEEWKRNGGLAHAVEPAAPRPACIKGKRDRGSELQFDGQSFGIEGQGS